VYARDLAPQLPLAWRSKKRATVIRVTIERRSSESVVLRIEGKITGTYVPELRRAWQELAPSLGPKALIVDLRGATRVDPSGTELLADIYGETNAEFLADTPLTKFFVEQAQQGARPKFKTQRGDGRQS
jgi:ABC-type transporter Mla MlaB component